MAEAVPLADHVSEKEAITKHIVSLTDTISTDLVYFSGKFIENGFITLEVSSDTCGMKGVGEREIAKTLLNKVVVNLAITQDRKKWFKNFVTIFSVEATYKPLAERMMQTYQSVEQSPTQLPSSGIGQQPSPILSPRQPKLKSQNQPFTQMESSIKYKESVSLHLPVPLHQSEPLRQSGLFFQSAPLHQSELHIAISESEPSILTRNMQHRNVFFKQKSSISPKKQVLLEDYHIVASLKRLQQCNSDNIELMKIMSHYKEVTEPVKSSCVTSTPPIETKARLDIFQKIFLRLRNATRVAIVNKATSLKKQVLQDDYNIAASLDIQVLQQCNSDNTELMESKSHYEEVTEPIKSSCVTSTPPIETKVRSDILTLQKRFLELINGTRVAIVNKGIDVQTVVNCVMKYRVYTVEDQDKFILTVWRDTLRGLEKMEELFVLLSVHWNYLHPEIYNHFIKEFKLSSRVSDECTKYCEEVNTFLCHTCVIKFYDTVGKTEWQEEIELMLVTQVNQHKWDPPVHLNEVDLFRKQNAHYCNLQQCAEIVVAKTLAPKIMGGKRAVDQDLLLVLKIIRVYRESRGIPMQSQLSHGADFTETVTSREVEMPGSGGDEGKENAVEVEPTTEEPPKPKVGERVMVSGSGTGTLRYVGKVKFASGIRMGVELDKTMPHSKCDGSRSGVTYFQCKPSHGMFLLPSRVKRMSPMDTSKRSHSRSSASGMESTNYHPSTLSSSPSPHSSPTANKRRLTVSNKSAPSPRTTSTSHPDILKIGMNVYVHKELGVVKYIGYTSFSEGVWLGVELRKPNGKNDGSVGDERYFSCKPFFGLFVKPEKATDRRGISCAKMLPESLRGKEQ